jgi:ABC-2 type transport system ATP-binding protein
MLMGILRPTSGYAAVHGLDVRTDATEIKQRVGYVPEIHHIYRWMRVKEVIGFCRSCYTRWNDQMCHEMLELFALDPEKRVRHLSKGTLVKLALLVAVSHEPDLLLLDEPLGGLDPIVREEFLDGVLRAICDRGQTVLISSHVFDDVRRLSDTVGILYEGKLLVQANLDELLTTTKRITATLRDGVRPQRSPAGTIWQRIEGRQWIATVRDFSPEKVQEVRAIDGVEHVEVLDMGLEELFKDFVKGQRAAN